MSTVKKIVPANGLPAKLSQPALRALHGAGYTSLQSLTAISEAALLQLHGMGPNGVAQIKAALQEKGLSLAKGK